MALCDLAHGYWDGLDWKLHDTLACRNHKLLPYLSVRPECAAAADRTEVLNHGIHTRAWRRCVVVNGTLLHGLRKLSVLMFGDSTSAYWLDTACKAGGWRHYHEFVNHSGYRLSYNATSRKGSVEKPYYHAAVNTHNWCEVGSPQTSPPTLFGAGPAMGSFTHFGATGPPYWAAASPPAPWVANTTQGQIDANLPGFCDSVRRWRGAELGCDEPTLIMAHSGSWDLSAFWLHDGGRNASFQIEPSHIQRYVVGVRRLVRRLRLRFPRSRIVWRTAHPTLPQSYGAWGFSRAVNPFAVSALNEAVRAHAAEWGLEVLDTARMLQQLVPRGMLQTANVQNALVGSYDGRHLYPWLHLPLVNLLLNVARDG